MTHYCKYCEQKLPKNLIGVNLLRRRIVNDIKNENKIKKLGSRQASKLQDSKRALVFNNYLKDNTYMPKEKAAGSE